MGSPSAACRKGMVRVTGGMQKDLYRVPFWTILWIFERPLGDERADFGRSQRHGWIRAGQVRPRIAPRGPGFIWEPFVEVRKSGTSSLQGPLSEFPVRNTPLGAPRPMPRASLPECHPVWLNLASADFNKRPLVGK